MLRLLFLYRFILDLYFKWYLIIVFEYDVFGIFVYISVYLVNIYLF